MTSLDYALLYASLGWHVFPLAPKTKQPSTAHGYHDASNDPDTIRAWWSERDYGIGIACIDSGLLIIDIDLAHDGPARFAALLDKLGPLPDTLEAETGGGGRHLAFNLPAGMERAVGHLEPGVDIKLHGYIVAAPSLHPSGRVYRWKSDPATTPIADLPQAWIEAIARKPPERQPSLPANYTGRSSKYGLAALEGECQAVKSAPDGARNNRLNQAAYAAGQLEAGGELDPADSEAALLDAATACGLPQREAERTLRSGLRSGRLAPRKAPERHYERAVLPVGDDPPPWEPLPEETDPDEDTSWTESLSYRVKEDGTKTLNKTTGNLALLLGHRKGWQGCLCYDELHHCTYWAKTPPELDGFSVPQGRFRDEHCTFIKHWYLLHHGVDFCKEAVWEAVLSAASQNRIHPVERYLESLSWDGKPRLHSWLRDYLGVEESTPVGQWWCVAAVARALQPGCQADHAVILEGPQGLGKSSALRCMAREWYRGTLGDLRTKDAAQGLLGAWIVEISEMEALRGMAVSRVKEFLSLTSDDYRPSYGRSVLVRPRSCVFAGTTNESTYLHDSTGGRRFWPVRVTKIDLDGLESVRDQLWAEAVTLYKQGVAWWPVTGDENALLEQEAALRTSTDPWLETIEAKAASQTSWSTQEVLATILDLPVAQRDRPSAMRAGSCLRSLGYVPRRVRKANGYENRYYKD